MLEVFLSYFTHFCRSTTYMETDEEEEKLLEDIQEEQLIKERIDPLSLFAQILKKVFFPSRKEEQNLTGVITEKTAEERYTSFIPDKEIRRYRAMIIFLVVLSVFSTFLYLYITQMIDSSQKPVTVDVIIKTLCDYLSFAENELKKLNELKRQGKATIKDAENIAKIFKLMESAPAALKNLITKLSNRLKEIEERIDSFDKEETTASFRKYLNWLVILDEIFTSYDDAKELENDINVGFCPLVPESQKTLSSCFSLEEYGRISVRAIEKGGIIKKAPTGFGLRGLNFIFGARKKQGDKEPAYNDDVVVSYFPTLKNLQHGTAIKGLNQNNELRGQITFQKEDVLTKDTQIIFQSNAGVQREFLPFSALLKKQKEDEDILIKAIKYKIIHYIQNENNEILLREATANAEQQVLKFIQEYLQSLSQDKKTEILSNSLASLNLSNLSSSIVLEKIEASLKNGQIDYSVSLSAKPNQVTNTNDLYLRQIRLSYFDDSKIDNKQEARIDNQQEEVNIKMFCSKISNRAFIDLFVNDEYVDNSVKELPDKLSILFNVSTKQISLVEEDVTYSKPDCYSRNITGLVKKDFQFFKDGFLAQEPVGTIKSLLEKNHKDMLNSSQFKEFYTFSPEERNKLNKRALSTIYKFFSMFVATCNEQFNNNDSKDNLEDIFYSSEEIAVVVKVVNSISYQLLKSSLLYEAPDYYKNIISNNQEFPRLTKEISLQLKYSVWNAKHVKRNAILETQVEGIAGMFTSFCHWFSFIAKISFYYFRFTFKYIFYYVRYFIIYSKNTIMSFAEFIRVLPFALLYSFVYGGMKSVTEIVLGMAQRATKNHIIEELSDRKFEDIVKFPPLFYQNMILKLSNSFIEFIYVVVIYLIPNLMIILQVIFVKANKMLDIKVAGFRVAALFFVIWMAAFVFFFKKKFDEIEEAKKNMEIIEEKASEAAETFSKVLPLGKLNNGTIEYFKEQMTENNKKDLEKYHVSYGNKEMAMEVFMTCGLTFVGFVFIWILFYKQFIHKLFEIGSVLVALAMLFALMLSALKVIVSGIISSLGVCAQINTYAPIFISCRREANGGFEIHAVFLLQFNHVEFGYKNNKSVFMDLCLRFQFEPNTLYRLHGPSGMGKSSVLAAIYGALQPRAGIISINNINLNEISLNCRRELIIVCNLTYTSEIFSGTIFENIKTAVPDITRQEVLDIFEGIKFDLSIFENGIDCEIGVNRSLSAGQKQIINIVRAIAKAQHTKKNGLIIMDEITNALDPVKRDAVFNYMFSSGLFKKHIPLLVDHNFDGINFPEEIKIITISLEEEQKKEVFRTNYAFRIRVIDPYFMFKSPLERFRDKVFAERMMEEGLCPVSFMDLFYVDKIPNKSSDKKIELEEIKLEKENKKEEVEISVETLEPFEDWADKAKPFQDPISQERLDYSFDDGISQASTADEINKEDNFDLEIEDLFEKETGVEKESAKHFGIKLLPEEEERDIESVLEWNHYKVFEDETDKRREQEV